MVLRGWVDVVKHSRPCTRIHPCQSISNHVPSLIPTQKGLLKNCYSCHAKMFNHINKHTLSYFSWINISVLNIINRKNMYQMNFISIQFKFKLIDSRDKDYGPPRKTRPPSVGNYWRRVHRPKVIANPCGNRVCIAPWEDGRGNCQDKSEMKIVGLGVDHSLTGWTWNDVIEDPSKWQHVIKFSLCIVQAIPTSK